MDCQLAAKAVGWLGETWGYWIQTVAFSVSALTGAGAVIYNAMQIKLARNHAELAASQARLRATVDMTVHEQNDPLLTEAKALFADIRKNKDINITKIACERNSLSNTDSDSNKEKNEAILTVLNQYEFMAIGIKEGAFDDAIYKRMKKSIVIRDLDALHGYITELRNQEKNPLLFLEAEQLAKCWKSEVKT